MKNKRLNWVDTLRGCAIFGMVIYHLIFDLNFLNIAQVNLNHLFWVILARLVQFTFLSLVGFSLYLSYRKRPIYKNFLQHQLKRALVLMFFALLITVTSYLLIGDYYIRFGVLHFISVAIVLVSLMIRYRSLILFFAIFSYPIHLYLSTFNGLDSSLFIPIGVMPPYFRTVDYFSIFPWLSVVCVGVLWAQIFDRYQLMDFLGFLNLSFFQWMGKRSLLIYLVHQPIFVGFIYIFQRLTL